MKPLHFALIIIYSVCLISGCMHTRTPIASYTDAIRDAQVADDFDGRPELLHCVKKWELHRTDRNELFTEMSEKGIFTSKSYVVLESGNAGWGGYYYAFLWEDKNTGFFITNMIGSDLGKRHDRTIPLGRLSALLKDFTSDNKPIRGVANRYVSDGSCFFLTIKYGEVVNRFAVYAPKDLDVVERSEKIVNQILGFIEGHAM